ncbi:MAG: M23 family metallopeptidase [Bacteroidales bacterium]|nr:M23 family metallopeptidase [Bacteroidales bacterium]
MNRRWIHFKYNKKKGRYERKDPSVVTRILAVGRHLLSGTIIGAILLYTFIFFVGSPSQWRLEKENELLRQRYSQLNVRLNEALEVLDDIGERDDNIYRVILQGEPLGSASRKAFVGNSQRYDSLLQLNDADLVITVSQKMDIIERQLYLQTKSFDEVVELFNTQEDRLRHIPAIQPVADKDLKYMASGYGWRIDPIYHLRKHHDGMDFSAEVGTDVFATGDGRVVSAGYNKGYGLCIDIDHGYGYMTRYAHLSKKFVGVGKLVKRGDKIGLVGNTGKSTGPHLHYEVHLRGVVQNPANYYYLDLTPEQYEAMIEKLDNIGQSMD